jgi:hypothetical protein
MTYATDEEKVKVQELLTHDILSQTEHDELLTLLKQYMVIEKSEDTLTAYRKDVAEKINAIPIADSYKTLLHALVSSLK